MKSNWLKNNWLILVTGLVIGIAALVLGAHGNPGNMGFCIACFLRDTAGALGLHGAEVVQYFRPEIVGILLGSLIAAVAAKEFKGRGGSSPMIRFLLGVFVMIGALMFLGCPLRMVIRIGGGDWNALVGLVGFIVGILVGVVFLKKGFTLGRSYKQTLAEGAAFPVVYVLLFVLWLAAPAIFKFSEKGPGSMHATWGLALVAGLVVGALCLAGVPVISSDNPEVLRQLGILCFIDAVAFVIYVVLGIRGANSPRKIGPFRVYTVIVLAFGVLNVAVAVASHPENIIGSAGISTIAALVLAIAGFITSGKVVKELDR